MPNLLELPVELLCGIASYVPLPSLLCLSLSCRTCASSLVQNESFWAELFHARFGHIGSSSDHVQGKKEYLERHRRSRIRYAPEFSIVWMDTPQYWSLEDDPDVHGRQVAVLHSVCWFQANTSFEMVEKGDYTPVLRVKCLYPQFLERLKFSVTVSGSDIPEERTVVQKEIGQLLTRQASDWFDIALDTLHVGKNQSGRFFTVDAMVWDWDVPYWKSGIKLDTIELVPVPVYKERLANREIETGLTNTIRTESEKVMNMLGFRVPRVIHRENEMPEEINADAPESHPFSLGSFIRNSVGRLWHGTNQEE